MKSNELDTTLSVISKKASMVLNDASNDLRRMEEALLLHHSGERDILQGLDLLDQKLVNLAAFFMALGNDPLNQNAIHVSDAISEIKIQKLREYFLETPGDLQSVDDAVEFFS